MIAGIEVCIVVKEQLRNLKMSLDCGGMQWGGIRTALAVDV